MKTHKLRIVLDLEVSPEALAKLIELSSNVETNNGSQLIEALSASIEHGAIKTVFENAAKSEIEVFGVIK